MNRVNTNAHISLRQIIEPYGNWFDNKKDNVQALMALKSFIHELSNMKCDTSYAFTNEHFSYAHYLVNIKTALDEELYSRACNEIISLLHHEVYCLQPRIKNNLLDLLLKYIKV